MSVSGNRVSLLEQGQSRTFDTDSSFDAAATNEQLYNDQIEPAVQRVLSGYNSFIVTYGASRTGKTHTLFGGGDRDGLIDASADSLFARLEARSASAKAFVTVSVYDVYNSMIIDLLNPNTKTGLNLLEHRSFGCVVDGVAELECATAAEVKSYVRQAMAVHDVLEVRITNQLGKPHTFVDVHVETIDNDNPSTIRFSTLRFCSPAGSGGVSLKFNAGLQSLSKVVEALAAEKDAWNVPYTASRLTRLLEPGLGGNACTVWITTIDASQRNAADTAHALEMAEKIRRVKTTARVNKNTIALTIRELREEIKKARGKLQLTQPGTYMHDIDPQQLKNLKQLIAELERVKSHTWEKKRQRSIEMNATRRVSLEQEGLLYTLTEASDVDIPEQMLQSSKSLLQSIVSQKAMCDDSEAESLEKRHLFHLRVESVQKNSDASLTASVADLTRADEKLQKLEKAMIESEEKFRLNQADLTKMSEEYRKLLTKIATIESKQRKMFLMGKDAAGLERMNKAQEWATMKREMESDRNLTDVVAMIRQNSEAQKQQLSSISDNAQLKDAALQTLESLRETTESVRNRKTCAMRCNECVCAVRCSLMLHLICSAHLLSSCSEQAPGVGARRALGPTDRGPVQA